MYMYVLLIGIFVCLCNVMFMQVTTVKSVYLTFVVLQNPTRLVGPQYRKTFHEIEMKKRRDHARKKEEKQKARQEEKLIANWNIDNQMVAGGENKEIDIK